MNIFKPMLFTSLKGYSKRQLMQDIISGIIVAIIALPLSIALAIASGVSPEQGLYTAIIAGFFISFLGGSRVQIGGPTAAFVVIIYGIVADYGMEGLTIATVLAGIMMILMGLFRFGNLISFIPKTITIGFTLGIAVSIFTGQLKDFFGLQMGEVPSEFIDKVEAYAESFHTVQLMPLLIGAVALLIQILWPKVTAKIPGSLIAILVATALVKLIDLPVATIGSLYEINAGLPSPTVPHISFEVVKNLLSPAFTIALLASIESLLSCVVSDSMIGDRHRSNTELVAQGVGNVMSAFFGGIPATGAIARTAANVKNGGRTPIAGMVHSITLLLILVVLMPYASMIPMPCLAAILIMVAYNMSEWRTFIRMVKTAPKSDVAVLVLSFSLTVLFDLVLAIEIGMVLSAFLFMKRMADVAEVRSWVYQQDAPDSSDSPELREVPPHTRVYEINGPLFFGAAVKLLDILDEEDQKVIILRMRSVPSMDISGLNILEEMLEACRKRGITLLLSHVNEQPMQVMEKGGFLNKLEEKNLCEHIDDALEKAKNLVFCTVDN